MITIDQLQNRIICADCLDILRQLPDKCVDLVLTDPPYGINFVSSRRKESYNKITGDNNLDWLPPWLEQLHRISKDNAIWFVFCSWHNVDVFKQEISKFRPIKNMLVWEKNNHGAGDLYRDFAPQYELILFCNPGKKTLNGKRQSVIQKYKTTGNKRHPTEKPQDMFENLIGVGSAPDDLVLDCFSGSGTTAVACHNLKRRFICIERDKEYCEASIKRLEQAQRQQTLF